MLKPSICHCGKRQRTKLHHCALQEYERKLMGNLVCHIGNLKAMIPKTSKKMGISNWFVDEQLLVCRVSPIDDRVLSKSLEWILNMIRSWNTQTNILAYFAIVVIVEHANPHWCHSTQTSPSRYQQKYTSSNSTVHAIHQGRTWHWTVRYARRTVPFWSVSAPIAPNTFDA